MRLPGIGGVKNKSKRAKQREADNARRLRGSGAAEALAPTAAPAAPIVALAFVFALDPPRSDLKVSLEKLFPSASVTS